MLDELRRTDGGQAPAEAVRLGTLPPTDLGQPGPLPLQLGGLPQGLQDVTIDHALLAVGSPVVSEAGDGDGDGSNDGDRAAAGPAAAGAVPRAVPPRKQGATRTEAQKEAHKDKVAARRAVAKEKRTTNGERRGSGKQRIRLIRIEDALLRRWLVVSPDV